MNIPGQNTRASSRASALQLVWSILIAILAVLALLLAWMGLRSIGHGLGVDEVEGAEASTKGVFLLLGFFQLFGAVLGLFGLVRFARTWRILPGAKRASAAEPSIRERALANLRAAQSSRN